MKNFSRLLIIFVLTLSLNPVFSQNFLEKELSPSKTYVLLAHPTVANIETINFLLTNRILQLPEVEFIGVYSVAENYDYSQSVALLKKPEMSRFHIQKMEGVMSLTQIFEQNEWTTTFKKLFDQSIGVFFFGGPDIQPEIYKQQNLYSVVTDPNRHLFELSFLFHLLGGYQNEQFTPFLNEKPSYFVTGFCLGLQSMNVATGGTLTQDIPAQTYNKMNAEETLKLNKDQLHRNYWQEITKETLLMDNSFHQIVYTANPFFLERVKADKTLKPLVLSAHHQSIDDLGKNLIVTATSMDGQVIEGIRHRLYENVFAVQFHPEVSALYTEGKKLKFTPTDSPRSFFEILSPEDREFHVKYWETISKAIKASIKAQKMK
ncbi:MAG: gamma-glutamyl-gamma-aminobutyrate hydrolase family protein [Prolixibacteraceae bacterium]|nr:gamma-glutamyl-gamma-aminobutyrate hydrolase family protein [Prolixibacteraceae bacterium]